MSITFEKVKYNGKNKIENYMRVLSWTYMIMPNLSQYKCSLKSLNLFQSKCSLKNLILL